MRAVIQRVTEARVEVKGEAVSQIGRGFLILLGIGHEDSPATAIKLAAKTARLRIFEDDAGKMNLNLSAVKGEALVVSQFTLMADTARGNRPSFVAAARPEKAEPLVKAYCAALIDEGIPTQEGVFGAEMAVSLCNDGPVTIQLEIS